jgi:hypothetical protein
VKTPGKFLLRLTLSGLLAFVLLEAGLAGLSASGRLPIAIPSYSPGNVGSRFWTDADPCFGVWHAPGSSFRHVTREFSCHYQANAWGMRDRERDKAARSDPRVVVLGDSFIEGWGVATPDRMSDRLESATGREYLNFGTSGSFGPTQYLMLYSRFARQFEPSALIIALLPDNDFLDDDPAYVRTLHASRVRPFFTGAKPDYTLTLQRPPPPAAAARWLEQCLLHFTYTGNAWKYYKKVIRHRQVTTTAAYAGYFDFTQAQWDRLEHVLGEFRKAAPGLPTLVLTIPCDTDFRRVDAAGPAPLPGKLRAACAALGLQYLDLMPALRAAEGGWERCYYKADRHWNALGNAVAAEAVRRAFPPENAAGAP